MCGNLVSTISALSRPRISRVDAVVQPDKVQGPRLRILVVDDSATDRSIALALLHRIGQEADTATNGAQATEAASKAPPYDVILMDINMPVKDGIVATKEITSHAQDPRKPRIFAMTGGKQAGREACQEAGMHGYLAKPLRLDQLVALVDACREAQAK